MATITPTNNAIAKGVYRTVWSGSTATADVFTAVEIPNYPDKTIEWGGTLSNAVIRIEGSNNSSTGPFTELISATGGTQLRNAAGAAAVKVPLQNPRWIRPAYQTATANASRSARITIISQSTRR